MTTNYKKTYNPYPSAFTNPIKVEEPTSRGKSLDSVVSKLLEITKTKTKQPTKPNQPIKTKWIVREPIEKRQVAIPYPKLKYHMVRVYELAKLHSQIYALKNEALRLIDKNNQLIDMLKKNKKQNKQEQFNQEQKQINQLKNNTKNIINKFFGKQNKIMKKFKNFKLNV